MRQSILVLVSLAAVVGSLVATLVTVAERDLMLRGVVNATQTLELPTVQPRLGANVELTQYAAYELDAHLSRMDRAGITWVRQQFPWNEIETQPGVFDWEDQDAIVAAMAGYPQMRLVAVLLNTPAFARSVDRVTAPPRDPAAYAAFAQAFARRYGDVIDYYQIWDEPNLTEAWGQMDPSPTHYLKILQAAWRAIHDVDKEAVVIAAALAPTTEQGPRNISDIDYLASLYALGAADWMDAVAAKPYGFDTPPDDRRVSPQVLNFSRIIALRELMTRHGDGDKPIHASAWGWNSLPEDWNGALSIWGAVTSEQRSAWTLAALERAQQEWPWLGAMILQHWQPPQPANHPQQGFALLDANDQKTPLLWSLEAIGSARGAGVGLHAVDSRWAQYSGHWSFGTLGADFGWLNDSEVQFDFVGEEIALRVREGDYVAWFYAKVDGQPANALPRDSAGNAYLTLTSATRQPREQLVTLARDLGPGPHRLTLSAVDLAVQERQSRWALGGFAVGNGNPSAGWQRQISAGLLATLVSTLALLQSLRSLAWGKLLPRIAGRLPSPEFGPEPLLGVLASLILMVGMLFTWGDALPALVRREALHPLLAVFTAGLVLLQPGPVITLVALLLLFVLFFNRPALGLMLTLFWAPFYLFPLQLFRYAFPLAEVMIILTTLAWSARQLLSWAQYQREKLRKPAPILRITAAKPLDLLVLLWLLFGLLALTWSRESGPALTELRVLFVEPALFYLIFRHEARDLKTRTLLTDALLAAGVLVALIGLWLFFRGEGVITAEGGTRRLVSVYGSPNNAALFLGRCLPFALAWTFSGPRNLRRWLALVISAVCLSAFLLTQSAGGLLLGLPLSLATLSLVQWRRRALLPLAGLAAVGAATFAFLTASSPRFARLLDFTSGTVRIRLQLWQSTLAMLRDDPLRGLGLDQFLYAYRDIWILPDAWREPNLSHPHNILFDFWVRLGLAGPLFLIALLAAFWHGAIQALRRVSRHGEKVLLAGAAGSMVSLVAHGLVDNSVFVHDLVYVFVLLPGLICNAGMDEPLAD